MAIPDYQSLMLPLLQQLADGQEHSLRASRDDLAKKVGVGEQERLILLPSGKQPVFDNRIGWAKTYMDKAGLVKSVRRGVYQITERGTEVLAKKPPRIDIGFLSQFAEFAEFRRRTDEPSEDNASADQATAAANAVAPAADTPHEALDRAYEQLRRSLEAELLTTITASTPEFFERLVVDLLVKMGYGGSIPEAGKAIGRSGDEGLDGVIKEDHLGLDVIYVQAKRWKNTVGRPDVQVFVGSLEGVHARKGVFLTTASFSAEAREYVLRLDKKVVLIDGQKLAALMVDFGVGVATLNTYDLKRIDLDYFSEG